MTYPKPNKRLYRFDPCPDYKDRIFRYINTMKEIKNPQEKKETCKHERTYVAVRHISGLSLVKCKDCGWSL